MSDPSVVRRARPLLGTLVEIGAVTIDGASQATVDAVDAAFARIEALQERLSRFIDASDIGRFNAAPADACIDVGDDARAVLRAAAALRDASDGAFDVTLGSGARAWRLDDRGVHKFGDAVRIDLGGIAKGHAVDCAVATLEACGVASGWVNAGGDLAAFGPEPHAVHIRHPRNPARLACHVDVANEALASSARRFDPFYGAATASSAVIDPATQRAPEMVDGATVRAPSCVIADALTKIVMIAGAQAGDLIAHYQASALIMSADGSLQISSDFHHAVHLAA